MHTSSQQAVLEFIIYVKKISFYLWEFDFYHTTYSTFRRDGYWVNFCHLYFVLLIAQLLLAHTLEGFPRDGKRSPLEILCRAQAANFNPNAGKWCQAD
jgi:hypothetical protein